MERLNVGSAKGLGAGQTDLSRLGLSSLSPRYVIEIHWAKHNLWEVVALIYFISALHTIF